MLQVVLNLLMLVLMATAGCVALMIVLRAPRLPLAPSRMALVLGLTRFLCSNPVHAVIMILLVALVKTFLAVVSYRTFLITLALAMELT